MVCDHAHFCAVPLAIQMCLVPILRHFLRDPTINGLPSCHLGALPQLCQSLTDTNLFECLPQTAAMPISTQVKHTTPS